jgi:hypothetical protein
MRQRHKNQEFEDRIYKGSENYLKNSIKTRGLVSYLKWWSAVRPKVKFLTPEKKASDLFTVSELPITI